MNTMTENYILPMAKYMSQAGADGYTGMLCLYHHSTTQLIIQWTGSNISDKNKEKAEKYMRAVLAEPTAELVLSPKPETEAKPHPELFPDTGDTTEHLSFSTENRNADRFPLSTEKRKADPLLLSAERHKADHFPLNTESRTTEPQPLSTERRTAEPQPLSTARRTAEPQPLSTKSLPDISAIEPLNTHLEFPADPISDEETPLTYIVDFSQMLQSNGAVGQVAPGTGQIAGYIKVEDDDGQGLTMPADAEMNINMGDNFNNHAWQSKDPTIVPRTMCKCKICGQVFYQKSGLAAHQRIHTVESPFQCMVCMKTFSSRLGLTKHRAVHMLEKPYKCSVCDWGFSDPSNLSRHMRLHTGEKPYKCRLCNKTFRISTSLASHMRTHTGEKPFPCRMCEKAFATSSGLLVHKRRYHNEEVLHYRTDNSAVTNTREPV